MKTRRLCKADYNNEVDGLLLTKGNYYDVEKFELKGTTVFPSFTAYHVYYGLGRITGYDNYLIDTYFYTIHEERKLKIENILL